MRPIPRTIALAVAAVVLAAAPAQAGEVILVEDGRAVRVNDPHVPSKREISLGPPVGGRRALGVAARLARGAAPRRADRRAVYRTLARTRRAERIARGEYR